jgi:hypothetical protein
MATLPTRLVEIEFDAGVWTDVAADVVSISTRRGRNRESGAFETGTMQLVLRNDTRKYDPDHTTGPYYGKLRPNRRVRFRATYAAVTYDVYVGYIDRITQQYGGPNDATAEIAVSDLFKILNRVELPRSVYLATVTEDTPEIWYHLDEPSGSATTMNSGSLGRAYDGTWATYPGFGPPELGESGLIVRDDGTAVRAIGLTGYSVNELPVDYGVGSARPFAIEAWVRMNAAATGGVNIYWQPGPGASGESVKFQWPADNRPGFVIYNTAGTAYAVRTSSTLTTGTTYHLVARHDADRTMHVFVNGVEETTADLGVPGTTTGTITKTVGAARFPEAGAVTGDDVVIDEAAIYTAAAGAALSSTQIAEHNTAGRTPWDGDLPGTRLVRVFTLAGVGDYEIDDGVQTLQATDLGGNALAYAQKVEETDAGRLLVTADGTVRFLDRATAQTGGYLTSQATLVDDDAGAGVPYRFVSADVDEATIVTRATVSREGSVAVTYGDAAAQTEFQIVDETHEGLLHDDDTYSLHYAQWIVNTHKTPSSRVGTVTLDLAKDPAVLYPAILDLELAQRVTYKRKPQNIGAVISLPMRVEAIEHATGGHYWNTRLQLSPFNLGEGGYGVGVWDTSLWDQAVWGL